MRLTLTLLCAILAPVTAANAAEEFNPYQAAIDRMPIAQALPLIQERYGSTEENRAYENGTVTVRTGTGRDFGVFLFCNGKMAGISVPVRPSIAARILEPMTGPAAKIDVYPTDDGVMLTLDDKHLVFSYWGIGTKSSRVIVTYPIDVFNAFQFERYCDELES